MNAIFSDQFYRQYILELFKNLFSSVAWRLYFNLILVIEARHALAVNYARRSQMSENHSTSHSFACCAVWRNAFFLAKISP